MDTEDPLDLHLLNLAGVFRESSRILKSYTHLFASLASSLILPLCFLLLAHHLVSFPLIHKIHKTQDLINQTHDPSSPVAQHSEEQLEDAWLKLLLFFAAYLLFVLAFSLLSTSAVVYSVACIYTQKPISYRKVLSVVPTVWKRLLNTFLWIFLLISVYHALAILSIRLAVYFIADSNIALFSILLFLLVGFFVASQIYISCIWHLASVISVLEESYGLAALRRSVNLIKGKRGLALGLFCIYVVAGGLIGFLFHAFVVKHHHHGTLFRIIVGAVLVALLTFVTLFGMLAQTVFYFACKAFHRERIDWSALSEHLGAYLGEYVPLKGSIQMEALENEVV